MVIQDLLNADKKLTRYELENIFGGFAITPSIVTAALSSFKILYEIGQNFGTSIRRIVLNNLCGL